MRWLVPPPRAVQIPNLLFNMMMSLLMMMIRLVMMMMRRMSRMMISQWAGWSRHLELLRSLIWETSG